MRHIVLGGLMAAGLLSGCAAVPQFGRVEVQDAKLSQTKLTLVLSNGTICRVDWKAAPVGRLDNCGPGFGYAVHPVQNPNALAKMWSELSQALGGEGFAAPMAEVVVTDSAGNDKVFVSPPEVTDLYN